LRASSRPRWCSPSSGKPTICNARAIPTSLILRALANRRLRLTCSNAASGFWMPCRSQSRASCLASNWPQLPHVAPGCLMPLGEAGQPCCDGREQLGSVHVGLLDVRELPTKRCELRAHNGAHQRLKRIEHGALSGGPHSADLDDLHVACGEAIGIVAGGLKVDDQHHGKHLRAMAGGISRVFHIGDRRPPVASLHSGNLVGW
jgi:hypothetical protein